LHARGLHAILAGVNRTRHSKQRSGYYRIFRYVYLKLLRVNATPERIGRGTGLGIFIGIFPTLWFGPALAVAGAGLIGANRGAALLGSFACGPLTPFTWTLAVLVGNWMVSPAWRISADLLSFANRDAILKQFFLTFLVGNITISIVFGLAGYALVWWLAHRRRAGKALRTALEPQMNTDEHG
jgi:uncharacterized protein (DUF2062 family)